MGNTHSHSGPRRGLSLPEREGRAMIGMDRRSGLPLSGLAHLKQSVEDILTTRWAAGAYAPSTAASCGGWSTCR